MCVQLGLGFVCVYVASGVCIRPVTVLIDSGFCQKDDKNSPTTQLLYLHLYDTYYTSITIHTTFILLSINTTYYTYKLSINVTYYVYYTIHYCFLYYVYSTLYTNPFILWFLLPYFHSFIHLSVYLLYIQSPYICQSIYYVFH